MLRTPVQIQHVVAYIIITQTAGCVLLIGRLSLYTRPTMSSPKAAGDPQQEGLIAMLNKVQDKPYATYLAYVDFSNSVYKYSHRHGELLLLNLVRAMTDAADDVCEIQKRAAVAATATGGQFDPDSDCVAIDRRTLLRITHACTLRAFSLIEDLIEHIDTLGPATGQKYCASARQDLVDVSWSICNDTLVSLECEGRARLSTARVNSLEADAVAASAV
jgi:hypothetical protein